MASIYRTEWQRQDDNFREQIRMLKAKANVNNMQLLSKSIGMKPQRLTKLLSEPWLMKLGEQRMIVEAFRRNGMKFDVTLGGAV